MHCSRHEVLLRGSQHTVCHHASRYALRDVVGNLSCVQFSRICAVCPLYPTFFILTALQVRIQQAHARRQHDLTLLKRQALVSVFLATVQAGLNELAAHVPEVHHRLRSLTILLDDGLGREAVDEQLLLGADVRYLHHLLDVLLVVQELLNILRRDPQGLRELALVPYRRRTKKADKQLCCKRRPTQAITGPQES